MVGLLMFPFSIDVALIEFDRALRAVSGYTPASRPNPAINVVDTDDSDTSPLNEAERKHVAGLMRVNHVGEVCAQALYQAQRLCATSEESRAYLAQAGLEEEDHLAWCADRLRELDAAPSLLNPLWYAGAFAIGLLAGKAGDKVSLGFVSETERQVEQHLTDHLQQLPERDSRSRAILEQMRTDEIEHGQAARDRGGMELPLPIRYAMKKVSKVMTTTAYRI
jgi:3-demethoxyubiquinol 3-hydroxylase